MNCESHPVWKEQVTSVRSGQFCEQNASVLQQTDCWPTMSIQSETVTSLSLSNAPSLCLYYSGALSCQDSNMRSSTLPTSPFTQVNLPSLKLHALQNKLTLTSYSISVILSRVSGSVRFNFRLSCCCQSCFIVERFRFKLFMKQKAPRVCFEIRKGRKQLSLGSLRWMTEFCCQRLFPVAGLCILSHGAWSD